MAVKIFFCYAREDEELLNKLKAHLKPLQHKGLIDVWYDRDISAGTEWELQIKEQLNTAQVILLLVSPDFMDSDYCYGMEMQQALERHGRGEARVIPIILRPVYWQEVLGNLQALPTDAKPIVSSSWYHQDEAFFNVTEGIRKAVAAVMAKTSPPSPIVPLPPSQPETIQSPASTLKQQPAKAESLAGPEGFPWLCTNTIKGHEHDVNCVAISPDGRTLASGTYDSKVKMWNLLTGDLICTLSKEYKDSSFFNTLLDLSPSAIKCVAFSPDGQTLASGSEVIKIWHLETGDLIHTFEDRVICLTISPDGQTLVSGSKIIKVWNLLTRDLIHTFKESETVHSLAISPDGQTLVSGSKTIKVWNLETGKPVYIFPNENTVKYMAMSPDGQTVVSVSADKTIKVWRRQLTPFLATQEAPSFKSNPEMPPDPTQCPKCGNPIPPNGLFCPNCGHKTR